MDSKLAKENIRALTPDKPGSLIVMLHGTGEKPDHILRHAHAMRETIPHADIICPQGPVDFASKKLGIEYEDGMKTWVKHETFIDHARIYLDLFCNNLPVLRDLHDLIDSELAARGLTHEQLGLFGFSLGGTIALLTAYSSATPPAAAVAHSGMFFPYPHIRSKPPTLWIMGDADKRYDGGTDPADRKRTGFLSRHFNYFHTASTQRIADAGIPLETTIVPGLNHEISAESLHHAASFIKCHLDPSS